MFRISIVCDTVLAGFPLALGTVVVLVGIPGFAGASDEVSPQYHFTCRLFGAAESHNSTNAA